MAAAVLGLASVNFEFPGGRVPGEVVLRPATCAQPIAARGYNVTAGTPLHYPMDTLAATTWAVELQRYDWVGAKLASPLAGCGEHIAGPPLATNADPAATTRTKATRRAGAIVITIPSSHRSGPLATDPGTITLHSAGGGWRTRIDVEVEAYAGSSDDVVRVRPGTCARLLAAHEFDSRLSTDNERAWQTFTVPIAFARFRREHFVLEDAATWSGADVAHCVQLSPA
jgi:hypothetical protein